jgi:zinc protease
MRPGPPAALDRRYPPAAGARRPFRFPTVERRAVGAGVELLMAPLPGRGLTQIELLCPGGAQHESAAEGGKATLTASLLDEGTSTANALDIARRLEGIGGSLITSADWDAVYLAAGVPAEHDRRALELLAELARDASFPADEVERLRRQRRAEIRRRSAQPAYLAAVHLAAAIYGDGPYGHSLLGSDDSVAALERRRIVAFARRHVVPAGATLVAVGDFDPKRFGELCDRLLAPWAGVGTPAGPAPTPRPTARRRIWIVDRPGSTQTELRCGHAGIPRRHADFPRLQVLNSILGGKFTSRLNLSLRERHAVTYGAFSRITGRLAAGPIVLGAAVATEAAGLALGEMLAELDRLRENPVGDDELHDARDYLLGVFPYALQTVGGISRRLETLAVHGLPDDYFTDYLARIEAVTAAELLDCARAHLRPERASAVAVGPAGVLRPQLEPHGEVRVIAAKAAVEGAGEPHPPPACD